MRIITFLYLYIPKMILELLKEKTSLNHRHLEESALLLPLSEKRVDRSGYQKILEKFYGYFHPLEQQISAFATIEEYLPDYPNRRHAKWLLQDWVVVQRAGLEATTGMVASIGTSMTRTDSSPEVDALPLCIDLPRIGTLAEAFGCLYVMEGSTLGGRFIARVVYDCLGFTAEHGARFFHGYGDQTGTQWKRFGQALVSFCAQNGQEESMVAAANQTFAKMEQWLREESTSSRS